MPGPTQSRGQLFFHFSIQCVSLRVPPVARSCGTKNMKTDVLEDLLSAAVDVLSAWFLWMLLPALSFRSDRGASGDSGNQSLLRSSLYYKESQHGQLEIGLKVKNRYCHWQSWSHVWSKDMQSGSELQQLKTSEDWRREVAESTLEQRWNLFTS